MDDRQTRLDEVARIALSLEQTTQLPAPLLISQWAVESHWGAAPTGHANYFGIKRASRHQQFCVVTTHEWFTEQQIRDWNRRNPDRPARATGKLDGAKCEVLLEDYFADYDSLEDSCKDFAWLIAHGEPYHLAWSRYQQDHDVQALVTGIAGTYATAPSYATMVWQIAQQANVRQAIAKAAA